jgi:hypothetical protein
MKNRRTIILVGVIAIVIILSLFIPAFRQGNRILSPDNNEEVVYSGNSKDSGNSGDTTEVVDAKGK